MKKSTVGLLWCVALLFIGIASGLLDYYTESYLGVVICLIAFFVMAHDLNNRELQV